MDYSDMTYADIQEILSYETRALPIVEYDLDGNQIVLSDGWTETQYMFRPIKMHYYKIVTYLPNNLTQVDYFTADGVHSCHVKSNSSK